MGCFRSSTGLWFNPLWHGLSMLLTLMSFITLLVVAFYNAPLDHTKSTLESKVGLRMWLLTVNETSDTVVFDDSDRAGGKGRRGMGVGAGAGAMGRVGLAGGAYGDDIDESDGVTTEVSEADDSPERDDDDANDANDANDNDKYSGDLSLTKRAGSGIHAYGLGIWGWCEWSNADWMGNARCTKSAFWTLPKSCLPGWDSIGQVIENFPYAVRNALSGASFVLVFAPFLVFSFLVLLVIAIGFPGPYPPWPVPPRSAWPKGVKSTQTKVAWILRDWRTHLVYFVLMALMTTPTIVVVLIGRNDINAWSKDHVVGGALVADPGLGFTMILVAWVALLCAQGLCMWQTGLIMKRPGKERTKYSKG